MKFGPVPVAEAEGALVAHTTMLPRGRLKKGHRVSAKDVAALAHAGHTTIVVAQIDDDDVVEDDAATELAKAICSDRPGIEQRAVGTGRANIHATENGLFVVDAATVAAINAVDPAVTLATLPRDTPVEAGDMVATVKIIPFAVSKTVLSRAVQASRGAVPMAVHAPVRKRVALISTMLPSLKESVMDRTVDRLRARLAALECTLTGETRVAHDQTVLSEALAEVPEDIDAIIVFGASAIVDDADIIPAALEQAGGRVERVGMPVDPGNLLMVGWFGDVPVIGAPGCARSPAENGFDLVLRRVVCDAPVDGSWIASLGVGGLLVEMKDRPQPRDPQ